MGRRKSRALAVQILYQLEMNRSETEPALQVFWENYDHPEDIMEFANRLVRGVGTNRSQIDRLITGTSQNWSFDRITPIDRSILRVAVFEILHCPDIPYKVTLNEAIELGKQFGSEKSGSFINGVLDHVLAQNPDLESESQGC